MKKKIMGLALVAVASLTAFNVSAQQKNCNVKNCTDTCVVKECTTPGQCYKDGRSRDARYEGLTLSDAQKEQLRQLDRKQMDSRRQQAKERRDNKSRRDSVNFAERRQAKQQYLNDVKAIVGPDQYVIFLENYYINGSNRQPNGKPGIMNGRPDKVSKERALRDGKKRDIEKGKRHADAKMMRKADRVKGNS